MDEEKEWFDEDEGEDGEENESDIKSYTDEENEVDIAVVEKKLLVEEEVDNDDSEGRFILLIEVIIHIFMIYVNRRRGADGVGGRRRG